MANLTQKDNYVRIEGILSEVNLERKTMMKNGRNIKSIGGTITLRVDQKINGVMKQLEIPVYMFAGEYTNSGSLNPAYESISTIADEFISIAASDINRADRVLIKHGSIEMNEYYGRNGKLVSFPRIKASFAERVKKEDYEPDACFTVEFMVGSSGYVTDANGEQTDKYEVVGMVPTYKGGVDVVKFYATNPNVIDAVSQFWQQGDTVRATGRLNFSTTIEKTTVEVDFGEAQEKTKTISTSELLITGGSSTPLEGDFAIDPDEVKIALAERKAALAALKEKKAKPAPKAAPAQSFDDLGF